jgi:hypothetical protein
LFLTLDFGHWTLDFFRSCINEQFGKAGMLGFETETLDFGHWTLDYPRGTPIVLSNYKFEFGGTN